MGSGHQKTHFHVLSSAYGNHTVAMQTQVCLASPHAMPSTDAVQVDTQYIESLKQAPAASADQNMEPPLSEPVSKQLKICM